MQHASAKYEPGKHPDLAPPASLVGVRAWIRQNLFSSPLNTVLTLFGLYILYIIVPPMFDWLYVKASFGTTRSDCPAEAGAREGACWAYIHQWFKQLMYGRYPDEELWRIRTVYVLMAAGLSWLVIPNLRHKGLVALFMLVGFPIIAFVLFVGDSFGLAFVETPLWGGMFLTLVIAISGIVVSLPIGVMLALGRRSNMPVVKSLCVGFIEMWRGVPLITVLFMASVMFPLFMPEGINFDKLLRALIGVMLFSAAYMAEVVRGGLQAIPKGQYEAAAALGLGYWRMMGFVILPQALKLVIPGIVNTFIGLFKDTTLVLIIGLFDFLGMAQLVSTNPEWIGFYVEGYVFVAAGFWIFCFTMSRYSQHLEHKLHTGHRR